MIVTIYIELEKNLTFFSAHHSELKMKKGTTLKLKRSIFKTCEYGWVQNPIQGLMFELFLTCLHWFKFCWLVEKTSLVSTNLVSPKIALFMKFFFSIIYAKNFACVRIQITVYAGAPPESLRLNIQSGEKVRVSPVSWQILIVL